MNTLTAMSQGAEHLVIIAEAGVNHNGSEVVAHQLIDAAANSGADFVKFQTFSADKLVARSTSTTRYQLQRSGAADQISLLSELTLPEDSWARLQNHAHQAGIGFLSTPFDYESARMLVDMGVDALKVSSGELTNLPFLAFLSSLNTHILVSTGMGSEKEVVAAAAACAAAPHVALFHCVSAYPAPEAECNLRAIPALHELTGLPVGWSDHTIGLATAPIAAALGARIFEKHFTLDRSLPGPDHAASLEPTELQEYVRRIKDVLPMLGDGVKRAMPSEAENGPLVRRSWHATRSLSVGHIMSPGDFVALRPEGGISPSQDLVGYAVTHPVAEGESIKEAYLGKRND